MIEEKDDSLKTLQDIRTIMERSARFISLSGWSGIWAGCTALAGAYLAYIWLSPDILSYNYMLQPKPGHTSAFCFCGSGFYKPLLLAALIFIVALLGGFYFTWRKSRAEKHSLWNTASRQMLAAIIIPLIAGAVCCLAFMKYGHVIYIAPACLIFYGLALINGSKYTLSDVKFLGLLEVALGCICLFAPGYGLYFWAAGFGLLHIFYGVIMWNKYDKKKAIDS